MRNLDSDARFESRDRWSQSFDEQLEDDKDLLMEQILENINNTPIGLVLKKIASLPEIRRKKVLNLRKQINTGKYDLNRRLDVALDRVLEELTT